MKITQEDVGRARGAVALDLLRSGAAVDIYNLSVRLCEPGEVEIIVWSAWGLGQAPEGSEKEEATVGARKFEGLVEAWAGLQRLVADRKCTVLLGHDYGKGAVVLGRLSDDGTFVRQ